MFDSWEADEAAFNLSLGRIFWLISVLVDHLAGYLIRVKAHILVHHCTSYRKFKSS
jgi:hypothetical protein